MSGVAERVAAGAAHLDEQETGWWERIDLDRLNLMSPCRCVLGQLDTGMQPNEDWDDICRRFGLDDSADEDISLGFCASGDEGVSEWRHLESEWRNLITERRTRGAR